MATVGCQDPHRHYRRWSRRRGERRCRSARGDPPRAEIADKHARSIKYQMTIAKLPLAKEIADFEFIGTPINEVLVRDLATGAFLANQRDVVLAGGAGSGKTHPSIAIARSRVRAGARVRFHDATDLVNRLEMEVPRWAGRRRGPSLTPGFAA